MPLSKLKADAKDKYVAFGKTDEKLGEREDIDDLLTMFLSAGDTKSAKQYFEQPFPSVEELKQAKTDAQLPKKKAEPAQK